MLEPIRKAFAKANGVQAGAVQRRTPRAPARTCKGLGLIYTDLAFLDTAVSVCEACEGKRFTPEVLAYKLRRARTSARCWRWPWRGAGLVVRATRR